MMDKRTVFVLGAGASCPYRYPSGTDLQERICSPDNRSGMNALEGITIFIETIVRSNGIPIEVRKPIDPKRFTEFREKLKRADLRSIDHFMAKNPPVAQIGKYLIAFELFSAENEHLRSRGFQPGDWYSHLFDRPSSGLLAKDALPDFSDDKVAFITCNYDRSLEYLLYDSIRNSFTEVTEAQVIECLEKLKILHVYGQVVPLKWQDTTEGVDYGPDITSDLLQRVAGNIRTIHEEEESQKLLEAHELLQRAERIFFLGFGYASENMDVLKLPDLIPPGCEVYGTAFNMMDKEVEHIRHTVHSGRKPDSEGYKERYDTTIEACDCLMVLRKYL